MSLTAISQNVTQTNEVVLTENQAREVIKDLVRGDAARAEVKILRQMVETVKLENGLLKANYKDQYTISSNLKLAMQEQEKVIEAQDGALKKYNQSLKQAKKQTLIWKIACGAMIIGGVVIATQ